jgi:4'-phosphopantetheinyl transferase
LSGCGTDVWLLDPLPLTLRSQKDLPLSTEEWVRAARLVRKADRLAFVAARVLARMLLARTASCEPHVIGLELDARGRPSITWPDRLRRYDVSISHTQGLVGVAIAGRGAVGLDLEPLDRPVEVASLADLVLAVPERNALRDLPAEAAQARFLRLWTLKEAYLKARGTGLAEDPAAIAFDPDCDPMAVTLLPSDGASWTFRQRTWSTGHVVAVCHATGAGPVRYHDASHDPALGEVLVRAP